MDLILQRTNTDNQGTFGELKDINGKLMAYTAEHAYQQDDGSWAPKVPVGTYTCQRGQHQLESMKQPFITFQVMDVPGHSNILLHAGNWPQKDSDGCILLGDAITDSATGKMVTNSKVTWTDFMALETGLDTFSLTIQ